MKYWLAAALAVLIGGVVWAKDATILERARALKSKGDYSRAIALYEEALSKDHKNADVRIEMALTNAWARNDERALELYDQILRDHPDYTDAYLGKATLQSWMGRYGEAEENYLKAISLSPDYKDAQLGLARMLGWKGEYARAVPIYSKLLEKNPKDIDLLLALARAQKEAEKFNDAVESFNRALEIDPGRQDIRAELGQTLARVQRLDDAITQLEKALAVKSSNVDDYITLGRVYSYKRRLEDSKRLYAEALKRDPGNLDALNCLARTYGYAREWKKSEETFREVLKKDPRNVEALEGLEMIERARGLEVSARYNYARFRTDDPADPPQIESLDYGPDAEWIYRRDSDSSLFIRAGRFTASEKNLDRDRVTLKVDRTEAGVGSRLPLPAGFRFVGRGDWVQFKDQGDNPVIRTGKTAAGAGFAVLEREWSRGLYSAAYSRSVFAREISGSSTWDPSAIDQFSIAGDLSWTDEISTLLEGGKNFYSYLSSEEADARGRLRWRSKAWPVVLEGQTRYRNDPDRWNYSGFLTVKTEFFKPWLVAEIRSSVDRDTSADTTGYGVGGLLTWTLHPCLNIYQSAAYRKNYGFKGNVLFGSVYAGYEF